MAKKRNVYNNSAKEMAKSMMMMMTMNEEVENCRQHCHFLFQRFWHGCRQENTHSTDSTISNKKTNFYLFIYFFTFYKEIFIIKHSQLISRFWIMNNKQCLISI